jgi:hypothetical protein
MNREPVVVQESAREWETWPDEDVADRGLVHWKTLLSADVTNSEALTMGIAKIPPGEALHTHIHLQAESTSFSKNAAWSGSTVNRDPSERALQSSYRATPRTYAWIRGRRIYGSPTFLPRTRLRRSSISSRCRLYLAWANYREVTRQLALPDLLPGYII